jgi:hypothetical protein
MDHYHADGADFGTLLSSMAGPTEPSSTVYFVPCADIGRLRTGTGEHTSEMVAVVTYEDA